MHKKASPGFSSIVALDAPVEKLCTGFGFTEGPLWHPVDERLIFSDMPHNHMRRVGLDGQVSTFRRPSNMANGNAFDLEGGVVTCEHATSSLVRLAPDG